ncbi:Gp49 [uncultured Mycobacterium sp.]|uniref:Gp49 n=1 Tax=uncultured Mycobacterium sp. TaxID=171292 RepID=A0A1Y5P999_9MYCO|nr:Gp49 [uncultured Mycobacterium sp.]
MSTQLVEIDEKQALQLWNDLRQHFINAAAVIEEIIEKRAWIPLGYESFAEAWHSRMGDVTLAVEVRPHVVYQMLTEGYDYDAVAAKVKGVGRDRAESLDRQRRNGVPARDASMSTVREHLRKKPSGPAWIHVDVGPIALKRYQKLAEKHDTTVEQIAAEAIAARFEELA